MCDLFGELGTSAEDDPVAHGGAPELPTGTNSGHSLASRVDAFLAEVEESDHQPEASDDAHDFDSVIQASQPLVVAAQIPSLAPEASSTEVPIDTMSDAAIDIDDMELVPEPRKTPIPPMRMTPPAPPVRPPPPIPRPIMVVPPRAVPIPALRPPGPPGPPRTAGPVPTIAIPA